MPIPLNSKTPPHIEVDLINDQPDTEPILPVVKINPKLDQPIMRLSDRLIYTVPTPHPWPSRVKCEMDLGVWENLMVSAGLQEDIPYILSGFTDGFCQGIPQHELEGLRWFTPPNHKSADEVIDQINKSISNDLLNSRILGPYDHEEVFGQFGFFRTNPMGSTVNGDGSFRVINDLFSPTIIHQSHLSILSLTRTTTRQDGMTSTSRLPFSHRTQDLGDWQSSIGQRPTAKSPPILASGGIYARWISLAQYTST